MDKFIVEDGIWDVFPDLRVDVISIQNFNNHLVPERKAEFESMLADASKEAQKFLAEETFRFNPVIAE